MSKVNVTSKLRTMSPCVLVLFRSYCEPHFTNDWFYPLVEDADRLLINGKFFDFLYTFFLLCDILFTCSSLECYTHSMELVTSVLNYSIIRSCLNINLAPYTIIAAGQLGPIFLYWMNCCYNFEHINHVFGI